MTYANDLFLKGYRIWHLCTHTHKHTHIIEHTHTNMHLHDICMHVHMHTRAHMYQWCIRMHTHTCTHYDVHTCMLDVHTTHTHTHTHTHTQLAYILNNFKKSLLFSHTASILVNIQQRRERDGFDWLSGGATVAVGKMVLNSLPCHFLKSSICNQSFILSKGFFFFFYPKVWLTNNIRQVQKSREWLQIPTSLCYNVS